MPTPLREIPHRYRPRRDAFTPAVSLLCLMAVGLPASAVLLGPIREGEPELPRPSPWLDADEQPLDLGEEQILELLSSAPVVAWETIVTEGTTRPLKVLLERDGVRVHGIFRTVDDRRFDRQRRWG